MREPIESDFMDERESAWWEGYRKGLSEALDANAPAQGPAKEELFCHWLKGYLGAIKCRDELDASEANIIRNNLNEMLGEVPALTSTECPVNNPKWSLHAPCPVCGALGPWFENGECVAPSSTYNCPEDK